MRPGVDGKAGYLGAVFVIGIIPCQQRLGGMNQRGGRQTAPAIIAVCIAGTALGDRGGPIIYVIALAIGRKSGSLGLPWKPILPGL